MTRKYQLGLDEKTLQLVRSASGGDGMAFYIHALVTNQQKKWTTAYQWLREQGWENNELVGVCQLIKHRETVPGRSLARQISGSMKTAYNDYAAQQQIPKKRWEELTQEARHENTAFQLYCLAEEFAYKNQALFDQLGYLET